MIATDPLSLAFLACFLLGFGFFLATALLGSLAHGHGIGHAGTTHHVHLPIGHHGGVHAAPAHAPAHVSHAPGHAPQGAPHQHAPQAEAQARTETLFGFVNPTTIGFFLIGFGFFGYFFHNTTHLVAAISLTLAGVGGLLLAAALLLLLSRIFAGSEGATIQDVSDRTGMIGKVSITIQPHSLGEIIYVSPGGLRKSIPARSTDGQRIERDEEVVVLNYTSGIAEVDTWEHFMHEEGAQASYPSADELANLRSLLDDTNFETELVMRKDMQKE